MTREETQKLITLIKVYYPAWTVPDWTTVINAWQRVLQPYSYEAMEQALVMFVTSDVKGFPPSIGQLIAQISKADDAGELTESEAWSMVAKATSNSAYEYHDEFAKLPDIVKAAVGSERLLHAWALTEQDTFQTVIHSQFLRSFREVSRKAREFKQLPPDMRREVAQKKQAIAKQIRRDRVTAVPLIEKAEEKHIDDSNIAFIG